MLRLLQEREQEPIVAHDFAARALAPGLGVIGSLQRRERTLNKHRGCVNTISFTNDGTRLISGSDDLHLIVWDWQKGAPLELLCTTRVPVRLQTGLRLHSATCIIIGMKMFPLQLGARAWAPCSGRDHLVTALALACGLPRVLRAICPQQMDLQRQSCVDVVSDHEPGIHVQTLCRRGGLEVGFRPHLQCVPGQDRGLWQQHHRVVRARRTGAGPRHINLHAAYGCD